MMAHTLQLRQNQLFQVQNLCMHGVLKTFWLQTATTENFIKTIIMQQQSQPVEDNSDTKSDVALQEVDS